jgi:hypothetical protein
MSKITNELHVDFEDSKVDFKEKEAVLGYTAAYAIISDRSINIFYLAIARQQQ